MSIWNNKTALQAADERRARLRKKGKRIAFDCMNLKCSGFSGERGVCALGNKLSLSPDGSVDIRLILNGVTPTVCKNCLFFLPDND